MDKTIQLAHGGGGRLSRDLIELEIVSRFGDGPLKGLPDGATLPRPARDLVFTTDSFVVQPLFFPGGSIGDLAVHGTVNDIAVCGGHPQWLSVGLVLEEGLRLDDLRRVLDDLKRSADAAGVVVVTGDTKVVGRGQCDHLFINSAGIGERLPGLTPAPEHIQAGDAVLVSGSVGDHGMAVLCVREGMDIENGPQSDTASVFPLVEVVADMGQAIRFMRDPTRGGLATVLNECVENGPLDIRLNEADIPVSSGARAVSEILGLDPLHVASEGRMALFCAPEAAEDILSRWRALPEGRGAVQVGTVVDGKGRVILETLMGGRRLVDVPRGELLPRIC